MLLILARNALKTKQFEYQRPEFEMQRGEMEGEVEEGEDESDILMMNAPDSDADCSAPESNSTQQASGLSKEPEIDEFNAILWSSIDPTEWKLECARVSARLKLPADDNGSEWRGHLEQARAHKGAVARERGQCEDRLSSLADEMCRTLERVTAQERRVNETMGDVAGEYKTQANSLNSVTTRYQQLNESVGNKQSELVRIEERLESVSELLDQQGRSVTDNTPLIQLKEGLKAIKHEGKEMEMRAAVLSRSLFQAGLR